MRRPRPGRTPRRLLVLTGVVLAVSAFAAPAVPAAPAAWAAPSGSAEVTFERDDIAVVVGAEFTIESRVTNRGAVPTGPYIAHLNVASLTESVYVDPEDWSPDRSQDVPPMAPGESEPLSWDIQAVNPGSFDLYVVLLPSGASAGRGPLAVSPPVHLRVAARRTLSAGGALPVALAVPVLLGMVAAGVKLRLRRSR